MREGSEVVGKRHPRLEQEDGSPDHPGRGSTYNGVPVLTEDGRHSDLLPLSPLSGSDTRVPSVSTRVRTSVESKNHDFRTHDVVGPLVLRRRKVPVTWDVHSGMCEPSPRTRGAGGWTNPEDVSLDTLVVPSGSSRITSRDSVVP